MIIINYSSTYSFQKPISEEKYNIGVFNTNMDLIDSVLNRIEKKNESQDDLLATKVEVTEKIQTEIARAINSEDSLSNEISSESNRAIAKEILIENNLNAEIERALSAEQNFSETFSTNKPIWDDKYTKNEIDNKFSALETNIDWKEAVETFDDILSTYPEPQDGWTVNVNDTDITYRFNGEEWIPISANAIPKATNDIDGLLSKEDHVRYEDADSKKHVHNNKSVLDGITSVLISAWNTAKSHAESAHARTDATKVEKSDTNGNIKINGTETNVYIHPNGTNPHGTTKTDIGLGNVENKSSATIRGELTKENVIAALGYTPSTTNSQARNGITYSDSEPSGLTSGATWIGT